MARSNDTIIYEVRDNVAYITMNRPEKLNAINVQMRDELMQAFEDVKHNSSVRVAIYTGAGRAFSAGHDLSSGGTNPGRGDATLDHVYLYLSELYKPIIAAINGPCFAQGAALALLSDIRIAVPSTSFGWPQAKMGLTSISGPSIATHYFPMNIAFEALFTGDPINAEEALRYGAVNRIVSPDSLLACAEDVARRICANAPLAIRGMKQACALGMGMNLRDRIEVAGLIADRASTSQDHAEGLRAYKEKRKPVFKGQ